MVSSVPCQALWYEPIVSAVWEAEAGESLWSIDSKIKQREYESGRSLSSPHSLNSFQLKTLCADLGTGQPCWRGSGHWLTMLERAGALVGHAGEGWGTGRPCWRGLGSDATERNAQIRGAKRPSPQGPPHTHKESQGRAECPLVLGSRLTDSEDGSPCCP